MPTTSKMNNQLKFHLSLVLPSQGDSAYYRLIYTYHLIMAPGDFPHRRDLTVAWNTAPVFQEKNLFISQKW
jgi:hypothetical protein